MISIDIALVVAMRLGLIVDCKVLGFGIVGEKGIFALLFALSKIETYRYQVLKVKCCGDIILSYTYLQYAWNLPFI